MSWNIFGLEIRTKREGNEERIKIETMENKIETIENRLDTIEDKLKDILSRINMNEYDIKRISERTNKTEDDIKDIIVSMQEQLTIINDYDKAMDLILNQINKKNPNINVQKPTYHGPIIDEEPIKDIRGTEQRYNEIMNLKFGSDKQRDYVFVIEMYLKDISMFKGTTYQELKAYLDEYKPKFESWKEQNNISYVMSPYKNKTNNSNKGVNYGYGM